MCDCSTYLHHLLFFICLFLIYHIYLLFMFCFFCFYIIELVFFFFFFQAEDGIRDATVTGVKTCALPISPTSGRETPGELTDPFPPDALPTGNAQTRAPSHGRPRRAPRAANSCRSECIPS